MQVGVRSPWLTIGALALELATWAVIARMGLFVYTEYSPKVGWGPLLRERGWWLGLWVVFDLAQTWVEVGIGRSIPREEGRGFRGTVPLAWVPGGRLVRMVLGLVVCLPVIAVKLLVYFVGMTALLPLAWLREQGLGRLMDRLDAGWEPVEYGVNALYNALHYCKVNPHSSAFSTLFNLSLPMWCLNH